jgi:hypothetical protein
MSATAAQPLLEDLAKRMAAAETAKRRVAETEVELTGRRSELARLRAEQLDYHRALGAGAKPDPAIERRLAKELSAPGLVEREDRLSDTLAEARLEGAREAHETADQELREFCTTHLDALDAAIRLGEDAERREVLEAARELARRLQPLRQRWRRQHSVYVLAGRSTDAPPPAFEEAARALAAMERG